MSLSPADRRECWKNIGCYYAYGECIECRSATLRRRRAHIEFFNNVFPYVQQVFDPSATHVTLKEREKNLWRFACQAQNNYFDSLRDLIELPAAKDYAGDRFGSGKIVDAGLPALQEGYRILTGFGGKECEFAKKIEERTPTGYHFSPEQREELGIIGGLLRDLIQTHTALDSFSKQLYKANPFLERRPFISVYVSLFVFVSHLGRAVAWYTANDHDKTRNELHNSRPHLHRAIMDANKLLVEALLAPGFEAEKRRCGICTTEFYLDLMEARRLEHDRLEHSDEEFNERARKYRRCVLHPTESLLVALSGK